MKSIRRILTLLLLAVCLATWVAAQEEAQLLLDSAHNAVIQIKKTDEAKGADGSFDVASDLAKGLATIKADFKLKPEAQKDLGDATVSLFLSAAPEIELIGSLDIPLPPEAKQNAPKKAQGQLESVFKDSKAYTKGDFSIAAPAPNKIPKVTFDGSADGTAKTFNGTMNFAFDLGDNAKEVPFKSFDLNISEKENLTTLRLAIAVDGKSPQAESFKQIGKNPEQVQSGVKSTLGQAGIQVEKVELTEFKDAPDVSGTLTIVLKDWRGTVTTLITAATSSSGAAQKIDADKLKAGVTRCLEVKINELGIKFALEGTNVKGSLLSKIDNMNALMGGYYDIAGMVMDMQLKDKGEDGDFGQKLLLAYQSVAMEDAKAIIQAWGESSATFKGSFKAIVEAPADKDGKVGDMKADGDFNLTFDNFQSFVDKGIAAGLPFGKSSAAKMSFNLADGARIKGSIYAYNDAKVLDHYTKLFAKTLKKAGAPDDQVKLAEGISFKGGKLAVGVSKDGINAAGYMEASSLVPVASALMAAVDKSYTGEPAGFSVSGKTEQDKMNLQAKIFINKLMEGKSASDIKGVLGLEVKEGAKPEDVKMVAVEKPEVKVPGGLVAVQDDGKKLLASPIAAAISGATGGKSEGGGSSNMLIIIGLIAAVVVGAGIMAGRKKG